MHACPDACTPFGQGVGPDKGKGWLGHAHRATQGCTFVCNYAKGLELMCRVRVAYTHELMHVHILTKVSDEMKGDCRMHMVPHCGSHFHATMQMP